MKKLSILFTAFILSSGCLLAQKVKLYGKVTDDKDTAMIGVTVVVKANTAIGTITDSVGNYLLELDPGTHAIEFRYLGYTTRDFPVTLFSDKKMDIKMTEEGKELDIVVVTGTKYEKKLSEEVVSMEVLKSSVINQNNARMDEAMNKVPGVNMLGKSIAIRGGSGFSDATGNRVLALLDGLPVISPESGGIIWDMVPIEELEQVEVIKGSSSALYGSSALNGVINLVTVNPKPEMVNKFLMSYGFYDEPKNKDWDWWWHRIIVKKNGKQVNRVQHPMFGNGQFIH
ncbi:MAG: Iron complex outer rane receptor protein [Bacteroidota bacterium]|nr:Iron complex outer rane receptor protein [Bacteroidota bacterium]